MKVAELLVIGLPPCWFENWPSVPCTPTSLRFSLLWFVLSSSCTPSASSRTDGQPTSATCDWLACVPFVVCGLVVLETYPLVLSTGCAQQILALDSFHKVWQARSTVSQLIPEGRVGQTYTSLQRICRYWVLYTRSSIYWEGDRCPSATWPRANLLGTSGFGTPSLSRRHSAYSGFISLEAAPERLSDSRAFSRKQRCHDPGIGTVGFSIED
ncbi:hypothetical protein LZ31DRAFT_302527 [Colletotrichum somersetense]|nr:hypothetical protein LZ31DRAFT_302527 [Colletotrichum somersetense]